MDITILSEQIIRPRSPIIVGIKMNRGTLSVGDKVYSDNILVGTIVEMQRDGRPRKHARKGDRVTVKIEHDVYAPDIFGLFGFNLVVV